MKHRFPLALLSFLALFAALVCGRAPRFSDITETAGVGGPSGDDAGGHGAMWADATGDGLPDLYTPFNWKEREYPDYFYRNLGGGRFAEEAKDRGVEDRDGGSHGAVWADLDNDGDYDLVNGATSGYGGKGAENEVYRNNGVGYFTPVTPAAMWKTELPTRALLAFDMDADGDLDIFAVSGYLGSGDPPGERNELYRNEGGFRFTAIDTGAIVDCPAGQGATATDFDGDGDVDLLAANREGDVVILRNEGGGDFQLVPPARIGIDSAARAGDGISTADIDNDGDLDLLLASDGSASLYRNEGGLFTFDRAFEEMAGYMGGFADLDNDGDLDLVFPGKGRIFQNDGGGDFAEGDEVPGMEDLPDPRSVAFADIDGDGDLDFFAAGKKAPCRLIRNDLPGENHWLQVRLVAPNGQAGAFGAVARVFDIEENGGDFLAMREAKSNHGYLAQDDPVLHFGLGPRTTVDLEVVFPDGTVIRARKVAADRVVLVDGSTASSR